MRECFCLQCPQLTMCKPTMAVRFKRDKQIKTTLGVQCLLLSDNAGQLIDMARQLREISVDYLTIKPYSQHLHSKNKFEINYEEMFDLEEQWKEYITANFADISRQLQ